MTIPRLLVVDDDDQLRTILSDELEEMGFDITTACNGQEAIEVMRERAFEMLVLDVKMPGIDGFQVLRYTKERFPLTKVIMVTAFDDLGNAMKSKTLGADDFMGKPYDLVELGSMIEHVLSN